MKEQETAWPIAEPSTGSDTDTSGSEPAEAPEAPWLIENQSSENILDTPISDVEDGPKVCGVMTVTLFEDETMKVEFSNVGRWTLGRLEKAMSPIFRQIIIERAKILRKSQGLPEEFSMGEME